MFTVALKILFLEATDRKNVVYIWHMLKKISFWLPMFLAHGNSRLFKVELWAKTKITYKLQSVCNIFLLSADSVPEWIFLLSCVFFFFQMKLTSLSSNIIGL